MTDDAAFNKGVDWFTEIVFFYGVLFGIAFYELNAATNKSRNQENLLNKLEHQSKANKTMIEQLTTAVERVKSLQRNNQKDIE